MGFHPSFVVVEDHPLCRSTLHRLLTCVGAVTSVSSCNQAASLLLQPRPHITAVIADVCLEDGSGIELATHFRALPRPPQVAIISGERSMRDLAAIEGFAFFEKPIRRQTLLAWAEKVVARLPETRVEEGIRLILSKTRLETKEQETLRVGALLAMHREAPTYKRIAEERGVAPNTVKHQMKSLLRKTGARSFAELVARVDQSSNRKNFFTRDMPARSFEGCSAVMGTPSSAEMPT